MLCNCIERSPLASHSDTCCGSGSHPFENRYIIILIIIKIKKMFNLITSLFNRKPEQIKAKVEVYTWQTCPFCLRAKLLLWAKGVNFTEYKIDGDEEARKAMAQRANGRRSVPQIFINNQHIGGCDDIYTLDTQAELDAMLTQSAT